MDRRNGPSTEEPPAGTRQLILNPTSGRGDHIEEVRDLAEEHGFPIEETSSRGHAEELTKQAVAEGVDLLAVCGGDGTVHEVVQGLVASDALDSVTLGILPAGTENIVANDIGVPTLADGFDVVEHGRTRQIDLGMVADEPFLMSAIVGLPADVSAAATHELKQRIGPLAFVVGAVQEGRSFDGVRVEIDAVTEAEEQTWSGEVLAILVGNLRRFAKGGGQANAEDGVLEVTIVERMPSTELVAEAIEQRLLHRDTPHVRNITANRIAIDGLDGAEMTFSLDGEIREFTKAEMGIQPRAVRLCVGDAYDPSPEGFEQDTAGMWE